MLVLYLFLQAGLATGLVFFSRSQNRELASIEIDELLLDAARGLQPSIERLLQTSNDQRNELSTIVRDFNDQTKIRVTVIDPQGVVLFDSDADTRTMENHRNRAEVTKAASGQIGKAMRLSESTKSEYYYVAIPLLDQAPHMTLRLAMSTAPIQKRLNELTNTFIWFAFVSAALASLLLIVYANSTVSPLRSLIEFSKAIAKGNYEQELTPAKWQGEWQVLGSAFNQMQYELRNRENALRTNSDRLSAVLASMFEGIIAIDEKRRVLLANRAASVLLEIPYQDLLNRPFYELVRHPIIEECIEEVFQTHRTIGREFETKRQPRRVLSARFSWISKFDGKAVVIVVHDVTSLRQLETMRRDFVANVSHELKTPLSSIKAYAETLRLGAIDDPENRLRFVERIEEQANRLSELIFDLIRLAQIESGDAAFEVQDIDLGTVAELRIQTFRDQATQRDLQLHFESTDQPVLVRCDEEGLATIIDNLISNAVRYTPRGGQITVRCSKDATLGCLDVIDNGPGIAPEHQERIFERFYRVDKARSSDVGGTGLGLSIVKHLTQSFSGNVSVASRLGKGTTFTVRLPLSLDD